MNMRAEYEIHIDGLAIDEGLYAEIMAGDVEEWGIKAQIEELLPETLIVLDKYNASSSLREFSVQRYDSDPSVDIRLRITLDVDGWFDPDDGSLDDASSDTLRNFEDGLISAIHFDGADVWYEFCGIDEEYDEYSYTERDD